MGKKSIRYCVFGGEEMIRLRWLRHLWWKVRFFWDYKVLKKPIPKPVEIVKALVGVVAVISVLESVRAGTKEFEKLGDKK